MKRRCMALLAAGMLALLTAGCGQTGAGGTLTVGVRDDIINFGYLNEKTGRYYGLEIDIAQEMAERMGYGEVEFVTVTPDNRKEMLLDGMVDCLIATYTISDTRTENFDFSPAYYQDNMQVVVEKSSMVNDISELKGLNIGTMSGANAAPLLAIKLNELGLISNAEVSEDRTVEHLDDITITKMVLCAESDRARMECDLNRAMKLIFDKYHISIPFPQIVINQPTEFKEATAWEKRKAEEFAKAQRELTQDYVEEDEENH